MTLIELMMAMLILGVLLSATAASLVAFSRTSAVNERRVQATAYLNELHENLQTIPWDRAALYDDEIDALDGFGGDSTATPPTFDGDLLVLLDAPDYSICPSTDPDCARAPFVPFVEFDITIDGRRYDVRQAISWIDRDGDGSGDVKRFTTVVSWEVLGQTYEQRFESERAPTASEVAVVTPPEVVQFTVTPDAALLDDDGLLVDGLAIAARFDRGITSAELRYASLDGGVVGNRTLTLTPTLYESALPVAFAGSIPAGSRSFPVGPTSFELVGFHALGTIEQVTSVEFLPPGSVPATPPPVVTSVTPLRTTAVVGNNGVHIGRLRCDVTVQARVEGLDPTGTVTLSYTAITAEGITMTAPGTITGSNDLFTWTFQQNSTSLWQPTSTTPVEEVFSVVARTSDGRVSSAVPSSKVTFSSTNGTC